MLSHFTEFTKKKEKAISEGNLEELHAACTELAVLYTNEDEFEHALREYKVGPMVDLFCRPPLYKKVGGAEPPLSLLCHRILKSTLIYTMCWQYFFNS